MNVFLYLSCVVTGSIDMSTNFILNIHLILDFVLLFIFSHLIHLAHFCVAGKVLVHGNAGISRRFIILFYYFRL